MAQSPVTDPSATNDDDQGLTAYRSLNTGDATTSESSLGEEGQTTSRVNRAATDDSGSDADETRVEHGSSSSDAGNATELDYDSDARVARDTREDAGNGAGSDAGRPPLRNGDTGYAG